MTRIRITHLTGDALEIDIRGHRLVVDQPSRDQDEAGPSPTELFVASLAACAGFYAERFLRSRQLPYQGLRVDCDWAMLASEPARVGRISLRIVPPAFIPPELREPLLAAVDRCTVKNSLYHPPALTVDLANLPVVADLAQSK